MSFRYLASVAVLATVALAKTDLSGCTSSDAVVTPANGGTPYATRIYYVPDTGEICALLDCGGGRAPPKTTVPGCASYEGTDTYSPSFLPVKTSAPAADTKTSAPATTPAPGKTSVSAAAESSGAETKSSDDIKAETETNTLVTATTSAGDGLGSTGSPANGTLATSSRAGSRTTGRDSAATGAPTNVPNAAATGSSQMLGVIAGVALGAVALL
ncbi:siderophore biosynthesis [Colletotrichum sojae]|uniref:Siderophore biosynthesis n=1 Tax=Colletotrichum sojae TaxID=2175907 RepID=A0A8H6MNG9_9PEZI|nr:siderophore biosynthesis [Colletotrichum sojae]